MAVKTRSKVDHRRHSNPIPSSIAWLSRLQTLQILGIEEAQLRRDQSVLLFLEVKGFDYQPQERGFTWDSLNVLWEFRQLVRERGRKKAIQQIYQHMENWYAEHGSQDCRAS